MSRVYFHSPSGTVELWGAERHHMAWLSTHLTWPILEPYAERRFGRPEGDRPSIMDIVAPGSYLHTTPMEALHRMDAFRTWYSVSGEKDSYFVLDGKKVELFDLQLNTLYKMGNDPLALAARIHGQCEIHAYVEGPNRAWLAGIMKEGRALNIYREGSGWETVIELLLSRDDEPVVMSYSVCEQFPNSRVAGWKARNQARIDAAPPEEQERLGDEIYDEFQNLPSEERWAMCMTALRSGEAGAGLELKPDDWDDYYFRDGTTCFDVAAHLDRKAEEARLKKEAANG